MESLKKHQNKQTKLMNLQNRLAVLEGGGEVGEGSQKVKKKTFLIKRKDGSQILIIQKLKKKSHISLAHVDGENKEDRRLPFKEISQNPTHLCICY